MFSVDMPAKLPWNILFPQAQHLKPGRTRGVLAGASIQYQAAASNNNSNNKNKNKNKIAVSIYA